MRQVTTQMFSVTDAATMLHVAPRTVRRWLEDGDLRGRKIGTSWVVLRAAEDASAARSPERTALHPPPRRTPAMVRQRLRQLGTRLITVGNTVAGARRARGEVFLTWRRPGRLPITFAIGRTTATRGWAPHALGTDLPFWLTERQPWRPVQRLLRRYEQFRCWCHPRLLCLPQVLEVIDTELDRLQAAVEVCAAHGAVQGVHHRPGQTAQALTPNRRHRDT